MYPIKKFVFQSLALGGLVLAVTACNQASMEAQPSAVLTVDEVNTVIGKGTPNWDTFKKYEHKDVGSGLYLWEYEVEGGQKLQIGGADLKQAPTQVRLIDAEGNVIRSFDS
ncbi:hypothetical protein B9G55_14165 [Saccharibacillus sp. O16]|nr:hypothetical protein B9G55_14165 [Saccharibacillus sp. O16]